MSYRETEHLRVLIANERTDQLALVAPIVANFGHEVIAREIDVEDVGVVTARERPDVALVGLGKSSEHALALIDKIVREAACPVILLIHAPDPPSSGRPRSAESSLTSPTPTSRSGTAP
jgi:response regulator NasT